MKWVLASDQSSVKSLLVQPIKKLSSAAGLCAGRGCALIRQLANCLRAVCFACLNTYNVNNEKVTSNTALVEQVSQVNECNTIISSATVHCTFTQSVPMLLPQVQSIYWQDGPSSLPLHPRLHLYTAHLRPNEPHVIPQSVYLFISLLQLAPNR